MPAAPAPPGAAGRWERRRCRARCPAPGRRPPPARSVRQARRCLTSRPTRTRRRRPGGAGRPGCLVPGRRPAPRPGCRSACASSVRPPPARLAAPDPILAAAYRYRQPAVTFGAGNRGRAVPGWLGRLDLNLLQCVTAARLDSLSGFKTAATSRLTCMSPLSDKRLGTYSGTAPRAPGAFDASAKDAVVAVRRLSMWRAECELALMEAEVLGGVAVDVRQGHVLGEERVPGRGVVHTAAQGRVGFPLQVLLEGCDHVVEQSGYAPGRDDPG